MSEKVASLTDDEKLVWDQAIADGKIHSYRRNGASDVFNTEGLIGGEGEYNSTNVNLILNRHMTWTINPRNATTDPNKLTVKFYVSDSWGTSTGNFKLNTAYQLALYVVDPESETSTVAKIVLPFEFTQPTLDITQTDSRFTQWYNQNDNNGNLVNRYLYAYGPMCDDNERTMYLPLYDAFDAWVPAGNGIVAHSDYVPNAEYYTMNFVNPTDVFAWGKGAGAQTAALDNDLDYNARYHYLRSIADANAIAAGVAATPQYEIEVPMDVDYKFYGVYPATQDQIKYYTDGTGSKVTGFRLVYASWLKHSTLKMKESSYNTERGTHILFLDNDDLNFATPKGDAFYLFDDIDANGAVVLRKTKNGDSFNEVDQHPFTTFDSTPATSINWSAKIFTSGLFEGSGSHFSAKQAEGLQASVRVASPVVLNVGTVGTAISAFDLNTTTGDVTVKASSITEHATDIKVYMVPSIASKSDSRVAIGIQKAFRGGMIIQLPTSITDGESVIVTVTLKDYWGYTNKFDITIKKLN